LTVVDTAWRLGRCVGEEAQQQARHVQPRASPTFYVHPHTLRTWQHRAAPRLRQRASQPILHLEGVLDHLAHRRRQQRLQRVLGHRLAGRARGGGEVWERTGPAWFAAQAGLQRPVAPSRLHTPPAGRPAWR
jgi:hypothetical protein